jgi:hypothetical protein
MIEAKYSYPPAVHQYNTLKRILDEHNIKYVCVQFPLRDVNELKNLFSSPEDVIFVDNEKIFKDAIRKEGYGAYFRDNYKGNFGHFRAKSRGLLAENIADTIEQYFRQNLN